MSIEREKGTDLFSTAARAYARIIDELIELEASRLITREQY